MMSDVIERLKELKVGYKKDYEDYIKKTYGEQNKFVRIKRK